MLLVLKPAFRIERGNDLNPLASRITERDNDSRYQFIFQPMKSDTYAIRAGCTGPPPSSWPLFRFGLLEITPNCHYTLERYQLSALEAFGRHTKGDWGDVPPEAIERNDQALVCGDERLFSVYKLPEAITLWIITESDRSRTTILLPQEYWATDAC